MDYIVYHTIYNVNCTKVGETVVEDGFQAADGSWTKYEL